FQPKVELGPDEFRRMVYQFKPRTQQDPTFGIFDCPDAALAKPRRTVSTTALQALNLLNSRFLLAQAESFGQRLKREVGDDPDQQVRRAFELAFGRQPTEFELQAASKLIGAHGISAFCRAIYNADEFLYVDSPRKGVMSWRRTHWGRCWLRSKSKTSETRGGSRQ